MGTPMPYTCSSDHDLLKLGLCTTCSVAVRRSSWLCMSSFT